MKTILIRVQVVKRSKDGKSIIVKACPKDKLDEYNDLFIKSSAEYKKGEAL